VINIAYVILWITLIPYGVFLTRRVKGAGWGGTAGISASWLILTAGLITRSAAAGHWPLSNRYEFTLCFVWALLALYLLLERTTGEQRCGVFATGVALLLFTYGITRPAEQQAIERLSPALRSVWLQIHVLTAAVGYGACGLGAGLAAKLLVRSTWADKPHWPAERWLEHTMARVIGLGLPWLTLSIVSGGIWAQLAWGRYWGWDPKETWSLVTWLGYLLFFHLRGVRGWRGRRLAWVALAAFAILLASFAGLPWLVRTVRLESLHGF
jgi:cytochrome c-type biogenesis protein CcsB